MTIFHLSTPYKYPVGAGLTLSVQRVYPPLVGVAFDGDSWAKQHTRVLGVGLYWCFVTVAVNWWRKPRKVKKVEKMKRDTVTHSETIEGHYIYAFDVTLTRAEMVRTQPLRLLIHKLIDLIFDAIEAEKKTATDRRRREWN